MSLMNSFKTKAAKAIPATPALQQEEATLSEPIVAAELQSQLAELNTQLETLTASKTSLEASVTEAVSAKLEAETALATALTELSTYKADTIKAQRTAQLASVLPEDEVATMLETTTSMNDTQFSVIFGALQAKAGKEQETFKEVGFSGANAEVEDINPLDAAIAAKYKTTDKGNK